MNKLLFGAFLVLTNLAFASKEIPQWSVQPKLGLIKGDYYKIEERFRQGHLGTLEVVKDNGKIVHVEFNELTRPNYYNRFFQNVSKRLSSYNFSMAEKKGAAWIQGAILAENQILEEQRLTGSFDTVAGASNSIEQSLIPLAEKLNNNMKDGTSKKFYSISEKLSDGLTGTLKVIIENGKIIECRYDEIFADSKEEIKSETLKEFYRQSKYWSVTFDEPSRIGFNTQMDALNEKVISTQNLLDLSDLPALGKSGDYKKTGFTRRNKSWDNYLELANKLNTQLKKDNALKK